MIPTELIEAFEKNKCGLFVGAGCSIAVGLPGWKELLSMIIHHLLDINAINSDLKTKLDKAAEKSDNFLMVAQESKDLLGPDFEKFISSTFRNKTLQPSELHRILVQIPFRFAVTTNYDNLIERAFVKEYDDIPNTYSFQDSSDIIYNLFGEDFFVLKAHGDASKPHQGIILTEQDYRRILYKEAGYRSILENIFSSNSILFVGASLTDPELKLLLGYIHNAFHGGGPKHFALISNKDITGIEPNRWRKDFNINVIDYDPANNHQFLIDFMGDLKSEVGVREVK